MRNTILITHANHEDNAFARWLAARLTTLGYRVWVDVRHLVGGNDFWDVIEHTLREEAIKQIVVVSESIRKPGVKKELALGDYIGKQLKDPDFMIPVRITPIAHGEFPVEILRRNAIDAMPSWASCLQPLIDTFAEAGIVQSSSQNQEFIGSLIAAQEAGRLMVKNKPETLISNWFPLTSPLPTLRMFRSQGTVEQLENWHQFNGAPSIMHSGLIGSICDEKTFFESGPFPLQLNAKFWLSPEEMVAGKDISPFADRSDARKHLVNLLRQHWNFTARKRGLKEFQFASGELGWFFPDGLIDGPVKATLKNGHRLNRLLTGKFKEKRWHLCLIGKPTVWPQPMLRIHANVTVTLDGKTPLPGAETQRLRLRLTKSWWNDKWRDMLLAGIWWLAEGKDALSLARGDELLSVSSIPISSTIDVSYIADEERSAEENEQGEITLDEELDDEEDDAAADVEDAEERG